jgi:chemotaxis signal transduction protein
MMQGTAAPLAAPARMAGRWVLFRCGDRTWGIALERVREILTPQPFTRLPGCGPAVAGLVGIRGRVVTAFDLGRLLASRSAAALPDHRLLLLDQGERVLGLVVDDVSAVADAVLRPPPGREEWLEGFDTDTPDVIGIGEAEGATFVALDLDALLGGRLA